MDAVVVACPHCDRDLKLSDRTKLGKRVKCPGCGEPFVLEEKPVLEVISHQTQSPQAPITQPSPDPAAASGPVVVAPAVEDASPLAQLKERRKRRGRTGLWLSLVVLAMAGGAVAVIAMNWKSSQPTVDPLVSGGDAPEADVITVATSRRRDELESEPELVDEFDPTDGEPIQLYMMPSGVNGVLHLRPRELWSSENDMMVLRASLTEGVVNWLETFLRTHCRREPAEIEEALFGVFLGARGTEPMMAVVVELAEDAKRSELIEEFRGNTVDERVGLRITETEDYTYVLKGQRTIAICPRSLGEELPSWVDVPNTYCSEGLLHLLSYTDRNRLCTLVFDVEAVRRHEENLFSEDSRMAFQSVLDWFGDEVETVSWSLHVDSEHLFSQMYLRTSSITSVSRLRATMRERLEETPHDMMNLARMMEPEVLGWRQIISRFPAMLEAFRMSTVINLGDRYIRMTTLLPAKAAPNLALGTMLTWNEALSTDFTASAPVVASNEPEPELTLEEKLKLEVDAEFNGEFLEVALAYIGDSIGAETYLDGEALENRGYTRNMRQTFNLGKVPAEVAFAKICSQYPGMVISVDHEANQIRLTTDGFATNEGREIYPLPAAPE